MFLTFPITPQCCGKKPQKLTCFYLTNYSASIQSQLFHAQGSGLGAILQQDKLFLTTVTKNLRQLFSLFLIRLQNVVGEQRRCLLTSGAEVDSYSGANPLDHFSSWETTCRNLILVLRSCCFYLLTNCNLHCTFTAKLTTCCLLFSSDPALFAITLLPLALSLA